MDSIRNGYEIDRVAASPTTEGSFTLKLTGAPFLHGFDLVKLLTRAEWIGLRVERDPRGPYKPSRVLGLTVDDVDRSVSFPSREMMHPWTWEVENESAV
jgi:hypothetical protein